MGPNSSEYASGVIDPADLTSIGYPLPGCPLSFLMQRGRTCNESNLRLATKDYSDRLLHKNSPAPLV
jgi:hypothetical protein